MARLCFLNLIEIRLSSIDTCTRMSLHYNFCHTQGLRRYKRLNFGTNAASEIFQSVIHDQIRDIPGILNISDDVIVFSTDQEAHDTALQSVFEQFAKVGLTLNSEKCLFNQKSLTYFGFVFSAQGLSPDPHKVKAIQEAPLPTSAKALRSFFRND